MADQSDVEAALVAQIQGILYPSGSSSASAIGAGCRVYRGWPLSAGLNADLAAGVVNISVLPVANSIKPVPQFADGWIGSVPAPGMVAFGSGSQVSFGGIAGAGQLAGLLVNGVPYVYQSVAGDTVAIVAAKLAAMVAGSLPATSSGGTVNVPGVEKLIGRTAAQGKLWREIRRQRQSLNIVFWCPTPQLRDIAVALVDLNLAGVSFLTFSDGSSGRLSFADTVSQDQNQNASIYRRDLLYHVEYATTVSQTAAEMMFGGLAVNGATVYS